MTIDSPIGLAAGLDKDGVAVMYGHGLGFGLLKSAPLPLIHKQEIPNHGSFVSKKKKKGLIVEWALIIWVLKHSLLFVP